MIKKWKQLTLSALIVLHTGWAAAAYDSHPKAEAFIAEASKEYNLPPEYIRQWLGKAEKLDSVLEAIARPAEKTLEWREYQDIFLTKARIQAGKEFIKKHEPLLLEAEQKFAVDRYVIAAIIGVETFYGTRQGAYRVLDSLSTLAFDYPERPLFWRELKAFFALTQAEHVDPNTVKGSYAGAMGYGQFIPSSYLHYAVDGDGDGHRDLWNNPKDAIFSVANYFNKHGWRMGEGVVQRASVKGTGYEKAVNDSLKPQWTVGQLQAMGVSSSPKLNANQPASLVKLIGKQGDEFWLAQYNYYVITRYNHSRLYAMAVHQLSEALH